MWHPALFIQAVKLVAHHSRDLPIWWRMPLAGLLVGIIGWHIGGNGYRLFGRLGDPRQLCDRHAGAADDSNKLICDILLCIGLGCPVA